VHAFQGALALLEPKGRLGIAPLKFKRQFVFVLLAHG
jgi:hypothetical protein